MAIVKASFTKSRGGAKASIRYIAFRPGRNAAQTKRELFGHDGELSMYQAERIIDKASKDAVFFRLVISPDPIIEDTQKDLELRELTIRTIQSLERKLGRTLQFAAVEHNDHTLNRHIHAIVPIPGLLGLEELALLREAATQSAHMQRLERDMALSYQQGRGAVPQRVYARTIYPAEKAKRGEQLERTNLNQRIKRAKPYSSVNICHLCGKRAGKGYTKCYNCGARLEITLDLGDNGLGY